VAGRADHLDPARVGLVIGFGALEAGQERVVDVDAAAREERSQIVGQDLHVARQHHQFGAGFGNDALDLCFLLRLGVLRDRQVVIGNVADQRDRKRLARVVADNRHDLHRQFADPRAIEQITQAMVEFRDHQHHAALVRGVAQAPLHPMARGQRGKGGAQGLGILFPGSNTTRMKKRPVS
jgi:hypothetical protein